MKVMTFEPFESKVNVEKVVGHTYYLSKSRKVVGERQLLFLPNQVGIY